MSNETEQPLPQETQQALEALPTMVYVLIERFDFINHQNWPWVNVSATTKVDKAIAWKNSNPWRNFVVKEVKRANPDVDGNVDVKLVED